MLGYGTIITRGYSHGVDYENLVFAIEAIAYAAFLKKGSSKAQKKGKAVGFAFVANAASFALGLWLAHVIPGIF